MARSLRTARSAWLRPRTVPAARTGAPGSDTSVIDSCPGHRLPPRSGACSADQVIPGAREYRSVPVIKGPFGDLMTWSGDKVTRCLPHRSAAQRTTVHHSAGSPPSSWSGDKVTM